MTRKEIWQFIQERGFEQRRVMHQFIKIQKEDFEKIAEHFEEVKHGLNPYEKNFRTRNLWKHLHATFKDGVYEIHKDFGNPNRWTALTIIPHLIFDVIPYLLSKSFCMIFWRSQLPKN